MADGVSSVAPTSSVALMLTPGQDDSDFVGLAANDEAGLMGATHECAGPRELDAGADGIRSDRRGYITAAPRAISRNRGNGIRPALGICVPIVGQLGGPIRRDLCCPIRSSFWTYADGAGSQAGDFKTSWAFVYPQVFQLHTRHRRSLRRNSGEWCLQIPERHVNRRNRERGNAAASHITQASPLSPPEALYTPRVRSNQLRG
jgi:hypothetical protein